ncbi:MAG TPA: VIT domain-containing protein [bacterium]|nr:VIT domain-containing protein [bacterium]
MKKIFLTLIIIITACESYSDGFIVVPEHQRPGNAGYNIFPLEVLYHKVETEINGTVSLTRIDQTFYNSSNNILEGFYIFPAPPNSNIRKFTMFINGKETEAELLDSSKARKIYEDIVRKQKDPALLEYSDRDIFKIKIFPIEPKSEKRIIISYSEKLERINGMTGYAYPLNTEKFSASLLKEVSITVKIKSGEKIKTVYCPTHHTEIKKESDNSYTVKYEDKNVKPETDFKLYFNAEDSLLGFSLQTYKDKEANEGFYLLSLIPNSEDSGEEEIVSKDIVFVSDVSGSMAGEKIEKSKNALLYCISNLNPKDRFQIIKFSTDAEPLFESIVENTEINLDKSRKFINKFKPIGGTNIEEAFKLAIQSFKDKNSDRPKYLVFITDGKPTIGETSEEILLKKIKNEKLGNIKIFTLGIGDDLNSYLLDKITSITKGYRSYISEKEDIELKISGFYNAIQSPVLTDVRFYSEGNVKLYSNYPKNIPDLFRGAELTIAGKYSFWNDKIKGGGRDSKNANSAFGKSKIFLEGKINGTPVKYVFPAFFSIDKTSDDFVPVLWASRRIGEALDELRLKGENKELIDEIVYLSKIYGIVTPYTSYLILEDEDKSLRSGDIKSEQIVFNNLARNGDNIFLKSESKKKFDAIKEKTGRTSVEISKNIQELNYQSPSKANQYYLGNIVSKPSPSSSEKKIKNIESNAASKQIRGRAFYNTGKYWVDAYAQSKKIESAKKIRFASAEYFDFLSNNSNAYEILALGKNVRFVQNKTFYEIFE